MKLRPILFSTPMVLALLAGIKTQTRRKVKSPTGMFQVNSATHEPDAPWYYGNKSIDVLNEHEEPIKHLLAPYQVGDVLWVKETYRKYCVTDPETGQLDDDHVITEYRAGDWEMINMVDGDGFQIFNKDGSERFIPWKSSMYMPFELARLFLEITSIRVERLQDISEEDSIAEGIKREYNPKWESWFNADYSGIFTSGRLVPESTFSPVASYFSLWDLINGEGAADTNPFVWVYEFKRVDKPVAV